MIRLIIGMIVICTCAGCMTVLSIGECGAEYPLYKKPKPDMYTYTVSLTFEKNGVQKKVTSELQCKYTHPQCNLSDGIYPDWQGIFSNNKNYIIVDNISENTSIRYVEKLCHSGNNSNIEISPALKNKEYISLQYLNEEKPKNDMVFISHDELKQKYGIQNLIVEYIKRP